jgi:two-component system sensor kinase FixL
MEREEEDRLREEITHLSSRLAKQGTEIESLRVSNLFLETLFEGINEEILVIDSDYVVRDVNRMFLDRHTLRKQDVVGRKCYEVTYRTDGPCDLDRVPCPLQKAKRTGTRVEVTHRHEGAGGAFKELIRIMYPLVIEGGEPDYFVEITRDVTDYKTLIRKLQASEKKFRAILDTATDAILSIDEDHNIILFNNAARRIFGYARHEALGKNLNRLIPPQYGDHYRTLRTLIERKAPTDTGQTFFLTALRKGGEEFPIQLGLSYLEMAGNITFTAIIRDVSEQKQLEKKLLQSERLAAVGQAVAHVAHEIKNPLMIIGGFSHQIRKCLTDPKAVQKLDMIFEEVRRLEKLVANLGDFTKEYSLVRRSADINMVLRDVLRIMNEIYGFGKYHFREELSSELKEIHCDPDKLKQVFMNVIANAVEAMEGGGTVSIYTRRCPQFVEIRISDEGIGIHEQDLTRIFDPFYTTRQKGSGLGLAISYKIIEAHSGEIEAESRPGEGTTFYIRLPTA